MIQVLKCTQTLGQVTDAIYTSYVYFWLYNIILKYKTGAIGGKI